MKNYIKNIFIVFLAFIVVFVSEGSAFAEIKDDYKLEEKSFFEEYDNKIYTTNNESSEEVSGFIWLFSFLIPGLGQTLLGNYTSIFAYIIPIIIGLLILKGLWDITTLPGDNFAGVLTIPLMGVDLAILLVLYIINLIEAGLLNIEKTKNNKNPVKREFENKSLEKSIILKNITSIEVFNF
ncbi:MAG: hypothetical protein U0457_15745 [Candidatus Sericytochromatia bacterium]